MAKRGKFSKADKEYMAKHQGKKSAATIATNLDRKLETVQEYLNGLSETHDKTDEETKKFTRKQASDRKKFHESQVQRMMNDPDGVPGVTVMTEGAAARGDAERDAQKPSISRKAKGAIRIIKKEK